ncbi:MalY/PatB family protein [Iodobacter fluviatilis]|uniref:Putative 8-amino-7-oxononanoate synthase n=1 Tax=Iodobacter fluviatilis TaxID=537 RepID=A0A377Q460_9NEIS|nr:PatB family C-S lyase [Iodobacter fluviatilis]TCU90580.1 cystathionine beta-lyase [Iodobacter fluviatilis]STQ89607.1 Cystathionine beta-lyase PatB [Iodobacter fluviatilis]
MDFQTPIDRSATSSQKWNKYAGQDILPMWVADMDFVSPVSIVAALQERVAHGVFGYTDAPDSLVEAVQAYAAQHYAWQIDASWIVWLPGLVQGLNLACRTVGEADDEVLTATPIYPPFLRAPGLSNRNLLTVPLLQKNDSWEWDFAALEAAITPKTKLLLLCHPHNPVGRAWNTQELTQLIAIARRHDLIICSDDIHCDLLLAEGLKHQPLAALDPGFAAQTITLLAPSKTWNIAGLGCSLAVIPDPSLRANFCKQMAGIVPSVNLLAFTAAEAAYRDDGAWHAELITTLRQNRDILLDWFTGSDRLKITLPEATYLAWIDARALDPVNPLPHFEALGVGLSDGRDFGLPGFVRLNFGCPAETLKAALKRIESLR